MPLKSRESTIYRHFYQFIAGLAIKTEPCEQCQDHGPSGPGRDHSRLGGSCVSIGHGGQGGGQCLAVHQWRTVDHW